MIRFLGGRARLCDGLSRREWLRLGGLGLGAANLNLSDLLSRPAVADATGAGPGFGRAKACIVLFLTGGPPQHSTWDPKPDTPPEVRGAFGPIATSVPGLSIGELLPETARVADKLCLLRAMSTGDNAHSSSGYYMLTGRPHSPMNSENATPGAPNDAPCLGGIVGRLEPGRAGVPAAVTEPQRIFNTGGPVWPGQDAGFLGRASDPWLLNARVAGPSADARVEEITLPEGLDPDRLEARRGLLDQIRRGLDVAMAGPAAGVHDRRTAEAFDLLLSEPARRAFRIEEERPATRDRYGDSPFGRSALLARRLVEGGVRLVQVNWYRGPEEPDMNPVWDSHVNETARLKDVLVPPTDRALSALIGDLDARGLLDETLVVCMSEFGRSPKFEGDGTGRGHWGSVFSVALAGGGVRGGQAYGASDRIGAYPKEGKVAPEDLAATIFHCLGHSPDREIHDTLERPHPISRGHVIGGIF